MPRKCNFELMMEFVERYLDGKMDRMGFDLDFNHYLMKYYPSMERNYGELADCFNFYFAEEGYDQAQDLSDAAHKKLIRKQYKEFKAAMHDGML